MRSNCRLGIPLLAAIVSTFGDWCLPSNSAAAEIFFLHADRAVIQPSASTESYENNTKEEYQTKSGDLKISFAEATTSLNAPVEVTDSEETSTNSTLTDSNTSSAITSNTETFSTQGSYTSWITDELTVAVNPTVELNTDKKQITGSENFNQQTNSFQNSTFTVNQPSTDITTTVMESNRTICIRTSGPTEAEVLAIAVGAVFVTIILSALLYQLVVYLRKKNDRKSSVFIIENELPKYDLDANWIQVDTKL